MAPTKLPALGLLAVIAFPTYYFIWKYVFPQPYESVTLRFTITALFLPVAIRRFWPRQLIPYYLTYCYWAILLAGPAFFTLMVLMNKVNSVWLMSEAVIMMYTFLLYDLINGVLVTILGAAIGVFGYLLITGAGEIPTEYLTVLPVYLFVLSAVVFLTHSERVIAQEKLRAARTLASSIAHEMRTPLLGIRLDANKTRITLGRLSAVNKRAQDCGCDDTLSDREMVRLNGALERIAKHAVAANLVIDMLLTNLKDEGYSLEHIKCHDIASTIDDALGRYEFRPGERELIEVRLNDNFIYRGVEVLMVHVLHNLIKNALRAVAMAGGGRIVVEASTAPAGNVLSISDTGRGIEPAILPYIFVPFVTAHAQTDGTGIGLSFCRRVVEGFNGSISCSSEPGKGATFQIMLPAIKAKKGEAVGAASAVLTPIMPQAHPAGSPEPDGRAAASKAMMPNRLRP